MRSLRQGSWHLPVANLVNKGTGTRQRLGEACTIGSSKYKNLKLKKRREKSSLKSCFYRRCRSHVVGYCRGSGHSMTNTVTNTMTNTMTTAVAMATAVAVRSYFGGESVLWRWPQ